MINFLYPLFIIPSRKVIVFSLGTVITEHERLAKRRNAALFKFRYCITFNTMNNLHYFNIVFAYFEAVLTFNLHNNNGKLG